MLKPDYQLVLGANRLAADAAAGALPLLRLRVDADLETPAAALDAWIAHPPGLSAQAGDPARLELGYDGSLTAVFTGAVDRVQPSLSRMRIQALTGVDKLLRLRINQVYESQTAGQIVADLAGQAGLPTGTIQDGLDLPFYVVDDAQSAYHQCLDLAERAGYDLFATPEGEVVFAPFDKVAPDHTFVYAQDVLALEVMATPPPFEGVKVWGESPASAEGVEAASWLVRDFSSSAGTAGSGATLRVADPAIRTRDAAGASAEGRLAALARRATSGTAVVLGSPDVALGDAVTFMQAPDERLRGLFQVKRVTHVYDKRRGFTTRLELWGGEGGLGGGL
jgi:phage protein D